MDWEVHRLVYKLETPVHIGWHTLGFIKLTRRYIIGKNIWGSMTANLVRSLFQYIDYTGLGKYISKNILTSYFYPATDYEKPILPKFTKNGLKYGDYLKDDFERLFIKSYAQTAVMPDTNTAEDESLHESEFISPVICDKGKYKKVYFVGYLFVRKEAQYNNVKLGWQEISSALREIFIGGDRKYGWGKLTLDISKTTEITELNPHLFYNRINFDKEAPAIIVGKNKPVPAHLLISNSEIKANGDIEPLVGREWLDDKNCKGAGRKISGAKICWLPGSVLQEEKKLYIGKHGILHINKCE